jgi:hypothetical protein
MARWEKVLEQHGTILTALQGGRGFGVGGSSFAKTPFCT